MINYRKKYLECLGGKSDHVQLAAVIIFSGIRSAHSMPNAYVPSVSAARGWAELTKPAPSAGSVKQWLESDSVENTSNTVFWEKLNGAMNYVLGTLLKGMSVALVGSMTVVDQIALLLKKGIDKVAEVSRWILLLIRKMMHALGMKIIETVADITTQLLRLTFNQLTQLLYTHVKQALNNIS